MLTIHQMAERTGVTIRALRYMTRLACCRPARFPGGLPSLWTGGVGTAPADPFFSGTGVSPGGNQRPSWPARHDRTAV